MTNPNNETFEQVSVFDTPALFTSLRIDKDKLPKDVHAYDIRHADDDGFEAAEVAKSIMVNHMGTIITKVPIDLGEYGYVMLEDEDDFYFTDGNNLTLAQFINNEMPIKEEIIEVVIVEPLRQPYQEKMNNTLVALQQKVGGYIEIASAFKDPRLVIICNEEGKIKGLPLNREINGDIIAGTFIIAGTNDDGEFTSLTEEQIDKYKKKFDDIEMFGYSLIDDKITKGTVER